MQKYEESLVPGIRFAPSPELLASFAERHAAVPQVELFLCFYFIMTGFHALHMLIGFGLLTVLIVQTLRGPILRRVLRARGGGRAVLAFRGHRLDFPVSASLFDWRALLMSEHVVPIRTYVLVFLALIVLTALTTGVAFLDLGSFNTVAALAIAVRRCSW